MRPSHMTIGDRHLVRLEVPGGVRVVFEDAGRERGPAVRRALAESDATGEARKADWPSGRGARPVGGPAGEACGADRETEKTPINHFSAAALKQRSDEATAEILRPLNRAFVALALGALVAAAAFTTVSLARLDRQIEQGQV